MLFKLGTVQRYNSKTPDRVSDPLERQRTQQRPRRLPTRVPHSRICIFKFDSERRNYYTVYEFSDSEIKSLRIFERRRISRDKRLRPLASSYISQTSVEF